MLRMGYDCKDISFVYLRVLWIPNRHSYMLLREKVSVIVVRLSQLAVYG